MQVELIIGAHTDYLRANAYAENTISDAAKLLRRLDVDLPEGLCGPLPDELERWLARRQWSAQTRETYRKHICRFFGWATRPTDPWLDYNPAAGLHPIKVVHGMPRPATLEQARLCCSSQTPSPWRLHCVLAAHQGLRPCEIARLDRADITERVTTVVLGKGGKSRAVPTHPAVWRLVEPLPPGPVTRQACGSPATPAWVSQRTAETLRRRYKMSITLYNLRHWFGTTAQETYGDLRVTQELMGHSSPNTTMIYTAVTDARMRAAVTGLPDLTG